MTDYCTRALDAILKGPDAAVGTWLAAWSPFALPLTVSIYKLCHSHNT